MVSSLKTDSIQLAQHNVKMPTLEVQLAKAQKDLDAIPPVNTMYWFMRYRRADDYHGDDAKTRGLMERIRHLQQRIEARNERYERLLSARALAWVQMYESTPLEAHTSVPTAPE